MKKSVMKSLATFLVLALMVASLPVAVFAEELERCHDESCYNDCETVAYSVNNCPAGGSHVYHQTFSARYSNWNALHHKVEETILYTCAKCAYSYHEPTGSFYFENHSKVIEHLSNGDVIERCTVCGRKAYLAS